MLIKKVFPFLAVLLFYCSSSSAYDQQYTVGGVGPNGGTVTTVTVVPELTNTQEEMVGDFLETTYTYTYTETIEETVNQTTFQTVQVVEEKTDQLINTGTVTDTNVSTSCDNFGMTGADVCTGNESLGGGGRIFEFDVSNIDNKKEIDYGATVYSHESNAQLPTCGNTTGDCQDEFKITIRLLDQGTLKQTYTHNYASVDWSGTRDYSFNQNISNIAFDTASLELYGMDAGYFQGYYGPGFSDVFFNLTYDSISEVINQIITQVEMTTIKQTTEYAYDSQYIPPPPIEVDYTDYTVDAGVTFELELDTFDGGVATFEVEVMDTPTGDFEIEIVEVESFDADLPDTEVAEPTEVASVEQEPVEESVNDEQSNETTEGETKESEPVRTAKSSGDSDEVGTETGGENTDSTEKPKSSNTKGSNKRSTSVAYSTVMETVRLVTMQQSQAVKNFNEYRSVAIPTTEFYTSYQLDGGNNYDNPYAEYYTGASDYLWNEMVDLQWQN